MPWVQLSRAIRAVGPGKVRKVIAEEKPERMCVELDEGRHASMTQGTSWQNLNVGKALREGKGFLLLASQELGIPCSLCDRNIQVTLRRAWSRTGPWGKMKMLAAMVAYRAFGSGFLQGGMADEPRHRQHHFDTPACGPSPGSEVN